jgi:uncharacterized protein (TIGR02265 family)
VAVAVEPLPPDQRVVYSLAFESLMRVAQVAENPALAEELRVQCGYDLQQPQREYPYDTMARVIDLCVDHCFPTLAREDAYEELGQRVFRAYRATLTGRVLMAALSIASVNRTVQLIVKGVQVMNNYSQHEVIPVAANKLIYRTHHSVLPPRYALGMLCEAMIASGNHHVTVTTTATAPAPQVDYFFQW